ncbi:tail fiber domain-containing protein [Pseudochryseolinea flava]|nr:tail fiber domain-containing protein [Pseudochryseolinea flava]
MKKIYSIFLFILLCSAIVNAQVTSPDGTFSSGAATTNVSLRTGTTTRMTVLNTNGFAGINTTAPTVQLDINGALRIRSLPTNITLTQILVADGSGNIRRRGIFPYVISANSLGVGTNSLPVNTGNWNVAFGTSTLASNTTGQSNTAFGYEALLSNVSAAYNTAVGFQSLFLNDGFSNTAIGYRAGFQNTGNQLTAVGYKALYSANNFFGMNTAVGHESMYSTTEGIYNTAVGQSSLYSNTTGLSNVAIGSESMQYNTTGNHNTACGYMSLNSSISGGENVAVGEGAQIFSTTASGNSCVGTWTLYENRTGNDNTAAGYQAGTTGSFSNTTALGAFTRTTANNQVRIGNTSVTSIGGQVPWSTLSDGRFKRDVKEDVPGISFINKLRPVTYVVDDEAQEKFLRIERKPGHEKIASPSQRHTGFVAQEVEKIVKESAYAFYGVDAPENEQSHYALRYSEFVVPLVKAVQELSAQVDKQANEIMSLREALAGKLSRVQLDHTAVTGQNTMQQNSPNPFSQYTRIALSVSDAVRNADVIIYNLEGKQIKRITISMRGETNVELNGNDLEAGIYLYALIADGQVIDNKRMILTR